MKNWRQVAVLFVAIAVVTALVEWGMGRLPLGPDGKFGWWSGDIMSPENSQRVADAYTFSHIIHGIAFYALLHLAWRKGPLGGRFLIAAALEAGWEILENSPIIIDRYREATIAIGYVGDSVLNSLCDLLFMSLGFWLAFRVRPWISILAVLVMEIGCLLWIRDNLFLNIVMLLYPFEAIKTWQAGGQPPL